jgi:HEAT repeat protein
MALSLADFAVKYAKCYNNPEKIIKLLDQIATVGEAQASAQGYATIVVKGLTLANPAVVSACIRTLGKFGAAGADYASQIALHLGDDDSAIQIAALEALGNFGDVAREFTPKAAMRVANSDDIAVKVAAITMLGNVGADEETPRLNSLLADSNDELACAACDALSKMGMMQTNVDILGKMLRKPSTCYSAVAALMDMGTKAPVELLESVLTEGLGSADGSLRELAVAVVGNLADAAVQDPYLKTLKSLLSNSKPGVRAAAATAMGLLGARASTELSALEPLLKDDAEDTFGPQSAQVLGTMARRSAANYRIPKAAALATLGKMKAAQSLDKTVACLTDPNWEVRLAAVEAVTAYGADAKDEAEAIAGALQDSAFPVRAAAASALGILCIENHLPELTEALADQSHSVRLSAVLALAEFGEAAWGCSHDIFKLLQDPVVQVQAAAARCLSLLGETGGNYAGVLATLLKQAEPELRAEICDALGRMGRFGAAFAEDVAECITDNSPMVSDAAIRSLMQMGQAGKPFLIAAGWLAPSSEPAALPFDEYGETDRTLPAPTRSNKGYMSALAQERAKLGL